MALSNILLERKESPYYRPPNLHMSVLKMKEEERVVAWVFDEGGASPATIKTNRVAAVSDGQTVTTLTLFEDFWNKVQEGGSYIIRGYGLIGETPPYHIKFMRQTKIFRASRIAVSPDLMLEAEEALNPPSQEVDLRETLNSRGLLTVCGEVVECLAVIKVLSGRQHVPVRNIRIKQDEFTMRVALWREVAVAAVALGDIVTISHMKVESSMGGRHLTSTKHTKLTKSSTSDSAVTIVGVTEESCQDVVELLLQDGRILEVSKELWSPFQDQLDEGNLIVNMIVEGRNVKEIKLSN
ncbi:hypothetical protein OJAV_G00137560 [Oryzias javanicus]|uniref:Replication protein A OB domain-containing protein n=1 Tax=Oryzias javanicus TaxID=123683 RepID=A0A3S2LXV2_ORYJA|nr:hypothetical protein OJAV_G00137560 [Oryzias javanicus]